MSPLAAKHKSPLISLFNRSLILAPIYTSADPYLESTQVNTSQITGEGRKDVSVCND